MIYTLEQEQKAPNLPPVLFDSLTAALSDLNKLHDSLKRLLGQIISKDMADQIGLNLP